jgi:hypothetical protein
MTKERTEICQRAVLASFAGLPCKRDLGNSHFTAGRREYLEWTLRDPGTDSEDPGLLQNKAAELIIVQTQFEEYRIKMAGKHTIILVQYTNAYQVRKFC